MTSALPPLVRVPAGNNVSEEVDNDSVSFISDCQREYGDIFTVPLENGMRMTYVLDVHAFPSVLLNPSKISFTDTSRQSKLRFGMGSLVESNEDVRSLSKVLVRALNNQFLADAMGRMTRALHDEIIKLADKPPMQEGPRHHGGWYQADLLDVVSRFVVKGSSDALFGTDFYWDGLVPLMRLGGLYSASISNRKPGGNRTQTHKKAWEALRETLVGRATDGTPMQALEGWSRERNASLGEAQSTLAVLLWGSLVNLIPSLCWALGRLMMDESGTVERILEELRTVFDDTLSDPERVSEVTPQRLAHCEVLDSAIKEALRLHTSPNVFRHVVETHTIAMSDGREMLLRKGDWIALRPSINHYDPEVFENPTDYRFDRFTNGATFSKGGKTVKYPLMLFGAGVGQCPGALWTWYTLRSSIALVLWHWQLAPVHDRLPARRLKTISSTPEPAMPLEAYMKPSGEGFASAAHKPVPQKTLFDRSRWWTPILDTKSVPKTILPSTPDSTAAVG